MSPVRDVRCSRIATSTRRSDALEHAERLGRQAMADIRRTVGLLGEAPARTAPEPDVDDIGKLVDDFTRAGLAVQLRVDGPTDRVSASEGLALYRIAQESLANIAKHAPDSEPTVTLCITRSTAELSVEQPVARARSRRTNSEGRGRARDAAASRAYSAGSSRSARRVTRWAVRASIPLHDNGSPRCPSGAAPEHGRRRRSR